VTHNNHHSHIPIRFSILVGRKLSVYHICLPGNSFDLSNLFPVADWFAINSYTSVTTNLASVGYVH
jgi:hypothetical protein